MAQAEFDPYDRRGWYFGPLPPQEATDLLKAEKDPGVFLIRDSFSIPGDFVLCLTEKEELTISHYCINKIMDGESDGDQTMFRIGERSFEDISTLLAYYKLHRLGSTVLVRPATKLERVIAKYDFDSTDPEDLPFRKDEVLTVLKKVEDQWWTARNSLRRVGSIPVPYTRPYDESEKLNDLLTPKTSKSASETSSQTSEEEEAHSRRKTFFEPDDGAIYGLVERDRIPNLYDKAALKLKIGQVIRITRTNMGGKWEGELDVEFEQGKFKVMRGHFPFTHVRLGLIKQLPSDGFKL